MRAPIGIFDSGSGGLTIFKHIEKKMPRYDYLYLGDHKRAPYGEKSFDEIYLCTRRCMDFLSSCDCPLIIIACNTASAKALRNIQQNWLPLQSKTKRVLGIIIPTAEEVVNASQTKHIGILATPATVESGTFVLEINKLSQEMRVYQTACPEWVDFVENREKYTREDVEQAIKYRMGELFAQSNKIDTLVLGCTHYPLLIDHVQKYAPKSVRILEQGRIVADKLADYFNRHPEIERACSRSSDRQFLTTIENPLFFNEKARFFADMDISSRRVVL